MKNTAFDNNTPMRNRSLAFSLGLTAVLFLATGVCQAGPPAKAPSSSPAAKATAKATSPVYKCPDCQEKFTEAQAKKMGMKCTCCQTKLVRIKLAKTPSTVKPGGKKG